MSCAQYKVNPAFYPSVVGKSSCGYWPVCRVRLGLRWAVFTCDGWSV